jgi:type IV pilus assembly protein PilW
MTSPDREQAPRSTRPQPSARPCTDERGVSLIEIMFAMAISVIVVGGTYQVLYNSQQMQTVNEQAVYSQQNARIAMELIALDLKDAGFNSQQLTYPGIDITGATGNCGINGILPRDNNPTGADTGPDSVSMIVPVGLSTLQTAITGAAPTTSVALQNGAVAAAEGFASAPYANPVISIAGYHVGTVASVSADTLTLGAQVRLPKESAMPVGMQVYWLKCIMYKVISNNSSYSNPATEQPLCGGALPCLVRGTPPCTVGQAGPACVAVVDGIEDLQLSYACDGCTGLEDGVADDQTGGTPNVFEDPADFVSNSSWNTGAFLPRTIRLAKVTVVARQMGTAMGAESASQGARADFTPSPLNVHDHNHANGVFWAGDLSTSAALVAYQKQQRRVLTRIVQLKNMGLF